MARPLSLPGRLATTMTWPAGMLLTLWHYLWRTTPISRRETTGTLADDGPPPLPDHTERDGVQLPEDGVGPLFHRRYRVRIRDARLRAAELVTRIAADPNRVAPREVARFRKVGGGDGAAEAGDDYVVRLAGPWDGPVRVVDATPTSFRLATLDGHLEAGQIEFRARDEDELVFEIESWARSRGRLANLLYERLPFAKESQLHMWTSMLEQVVDLSGGRRSGRIEIETRRVDG